MRKSSRVHYEQLLAGEKTQFTLIRALEIVGERSKKVPLSVLDKPAAIPWKEIAGMRDNDSHDDMGVDAVIVWKTVTADLPSLVPK